MAAKMDDDAFYKRVISSCYMKIVEDLDPDPLIDEMKVEKFLPSVAIRDIREQRTTSEKNRKIVERVLSRGPEGYSLFIKMLGKSGNEYLRDFIKTKEEKLKANERQKQKQLQQKRANEKMNPRHPVPVNVPQPSHNKPFRGGPEDNPIPFPVPRRGENDISRQYVPIDPVPVNVPQPSNDKSIPFRGGPELPSNEPINTDMSKLSVRDDIDASPLKSTFFEEICIKNRRPKFDGRIMEIDYIKFEKDIRRSIKTERGGFGEVFHVKDRGKDGIGDFVIKKICFKDGDGKERSAASEMLAARLLHFAIVPLLAKAEHREKG